MPEQQQNGTLKLFGVSESGRKPVMILLVPFYKLVVSPVCPSLTQEDECSLYILVLLYSSVCIGKAGSIFKVSNVTK